VTWVKGVPPLAKERLEPSVEVHWCRVRWHSDVSKVASTIPGGNVHAAAQSNREVGIIATYTNPFMKRIERGSIIPSVAISKVDMIVDKIADRLHALPSGLCAAKRLPREVNQLLSFTVPAAQQKNENVVGEFIDRMLSRA
jgi:hypothetical protein